MPRIRAVIFDYYNTLIDIRTDEEKPEVFHLLSLYLQYYGLNMNEQNLRSALDHEKKQYLKAKDEAYPEIDLEVVFSSILEKEGICNTLAAESCCKLFRLLSRERFQLFPDSIPVLKEIKRSGYPMAVVSDAQKVFCLEEGEMLGLNQFFDHIVLSTQFGFRKPDGRLFAIACSLLDIPPAQAIYIGDDLRKDVKGAKQAGMAAILVSRNPQQNSETEIEADFCASNLWEAWDWIKKGG
jgi:putative hydrolase of the HAD superfamily